MATYLELFLLSQNTDLIQRLTVAVAVECDVIRVEDPATPYHDTRVAWAQRALENPDGTARQMLMCALAQNKGLSPAQIAAAPDATLQSAVSAAIPLFM